MTRNFLPRPLVALLALVAVCNAASFQVPVTLHHAAKHPTTPSNKPGRQDLINALGLYLIGAIEVGSPGQPLLVDFDLTTTLTYLFDGEVLGQECGLCFNKRKPFGLSVANASITFGSIDDHCAWGKNSFFVDLTEPKPETQSDPWSAMWTFQLDSITFKGPNGAKSKMRIARNATVWIWHGILAPWDDLEPIAKKLRASYDGVRGYVVDCANLKRLPALHFMIGKRSIGLKPIEYTYEVDGKCYLSFKAAEWFMMEIPVWVVGTHFFTNHCFVGDFGANRIGFAEKRQAWQ